MVLEDQDESLKIIWCNDQVDVLEYQVVVIKIVMLRYQVIYVYLGRQHLMSSDVEVSEDLWSSSLSNDGVYHEELSQVS